MKEYTQEMHDQLDRLVKASAENEIWGTDRTQKALNSASKSFYRSKRRAIKVTTDNYIRGGKYNQYKAR